MKQLKEKIDALSSPAEIVSSLHAAEQQAERMMQRVITLLAKSAGQMFYASYNIDPLELYAAGGYEMIERIPDNYRLSFTPANSPIPLH